MIADALKGKTILITGSTGFLGKSIVEKCLRSIPDIALINLAIRSSARRPAADRLEREVLSSPAFKRLKEELGEERFAALAAEKLAVIEIDLGREGLGLSEAAQDQIRACDIVIHSAAAVEFDNPADPANTTSIFSDILSQTFTGDGRATLSWLEGLGESTVGAEYEVQAGKYAGREQVLDFRIPGLGVKFDDAVHCAALHPYHLYRARVAAGFEVPLRPEPPAAMTGLAFEIPIERIFEHPVVWYSCRTLWINSFGNWISNRSRRSYS